MFTKSRFAMLLSGQLLLLCLQFFVFYPCLLGANIQETQPVDAQVKSRSKRDFAQAPPNPRAEGAQGIAPQGPDGNPNQNQESLRYTPSWDSLEKRAIPQWYDDAKLGIFIHWGVYSVPSFVGEWFWYYWRTGKTESTFHTQQAVDSVRNFMAQNYPPDFKYTDFASEFTAEFFDPAQWVDMFKASGAKYVVLTSKHHDGFTLWPSKKSWNWNSVDNGPHRDLVGDLAKALRTNSDLKFGVYHSLYEWYNPLYLEDREKGYATQNYVKEKLMPELKELVEVYKPEIVWADGQWEASCDYFNCTQFISWLYNDSPVKDTVVINDRWGMDTMCKHGGFLTCETSKNSVNKQTRKWEQGMTLDKESWGYRRNAVLKDYHSMVGLLELLADSVSTGGNLLMNIGATADGRIPTICEERLRQMGQWLNVNGAAIYGTHAWHTAKDPNNPKVFYTAKTSSDLAGVVVVHAILLQWPTDDLLDLAAPEAGNHTTIQWSGYKGGNLAWQRKPSGGIIISLPKVSLSSIPSEYAWTFTLTGLHNSD